MAKAPPPPCSERGWRFLFTDFSVASPLRNAFSTDLAPNPGIRIMTGASATNVFGCILGCDEERLFLPIFGTYSGFSNSDPAHFLLFIK